MGIAVRVGLDGRERQVVFLQEPGRVAGLQGEVHVLRNDSLLRERKGVQRADRDSEQLAAV